MPSNLSKNKNAISALLKIIIYNICVFLFVNIKNKKENPLNNKDFWKDLMNVDW